MHAQPNVMKVLVANKADLKKEVTTEEGMEVAKQYGMKYIEASAFSGLGVKEIFEDVCIDLVKKAIIDQQNEESTPKVKDQDHQKPFRIS